MMVQLEVTGGNGRIRTKNSNNNNVLIYKNNENTGKYCQNQPIRTLEISQRLSVI